jgi:hypothetical protein
LNGPNLAQGILESTHHDLVENQLGDDNGAGFEIDEILDHIPVPNRGLNGRNVAALAWAGVSGFQPALFTIRCWIIGQAREEISQPR